MTTGDQVERLYREGKYREVIALAPNSLQAAWAYYQLGAFGDAENIADNVASIFSPATHKGESARLLLAHCAERQGKLKEAYLRVLSLPSSSARDNLYVILLIAARRSGEAIDVAVALRLGADAMMRPLHQILDAHIINNVAWLLHRARDQEDVRQMLPILPGLVEMAIGIYDAVGAADNHRAGVRFRAALIFEAAGWLEGARTLIGQSIELWQELVAREGGERFQANFAGAEEVLQRLTP